MLTVSSELDREFVQQIILKAQVNDTASVKEKVPQIDSGMPEESEIERFFMPKELIYINFLYIL